MTTTMVLTEEQSLTKTLTLAAAVKLKVTLLLKSNKKYPWDEALLKHQHLGQTDRTNTINNNNNNGPDKGQSLTLTKTMTLAVTVELFVKIKNIKAH